MKPLLLLISTFWLSFPFQAAAGLVAHRGALKEAPENTLTAQRIAYLRGADFVEIDVRESKDGELVIMHVPYLSATMAAVGNVGDFTYAELLQFRYYGTRWNAERIPTAKQMLQQAADFGKSLVLDIKVPGLAARIRAAVDAVGISERQIHFLTWNLSDSAEYNAAFPDSTIFLSTARQISSISDAEFGYWRSKGVEGVLYGSATGITRAEIETLHRNSLLAAHIYSPDTWSFYYQDLGLDYFWVDDIALSVTRLQQQATLWNAWADAAGLPPGHRETWRDQDGDGQSNLTDYATSRPMGSISSGGSSGLRPARNRLQAAPGTTPEPVLPYQITLTSGWQHLITPHPQASEDLVHWTDLPADCCETVDPDSLLFNFPISGRKNRYFRVSFDIVR